MLYVVLWKTALNMKGIRETGDIRGETRGPAFSRIRGILFGCSLSQIPNLDSDLLGNCGEWAIIFHRSPGMELPPELEEPITCSHTLLHWKRPHSLTMKHFQSYEVSSSYFRTIYHLPSTKAMDLLY